MYIKIVTGESVTRSLQMVKLYYIKILKLIHHNVSLFLQLNLVKYKKNYAHNFDINEIVFIKLLYNW